MRAMMLLLGAIVMIGLCSQNNATAEDAPAAPPPGRQQWDPEQMRQRMLDRIKERLARIVDPEAGSTVNADGHAGINRSAPKGTKVRVKSILTELQTAGLLDAKGIELAGPLLSQGKPLDEALISSGALTEEQALR